MARDALGPEELTRPVPVAWRTWFGFLGAPSVWAIHFMVVYALMEVGCVAGWDRFVVAGINGVALATLLGTLLSVPAIVAAGWVAYGLWRRSPRDTPPGKETADQNTHVGQAGVFLSVLFLLAVIFETIPVFVLRPCGWGIG